MTIQIMEESRSPIKTILLEHHVGAAVEFKPAYAVRELRWFRSEEEAREHYEQAVRSRTSHSKQSTKATNSESAVKMESALERIIEPVKAFPFTIIIRTGRTEPPQRRGSVPIDIFSKSVS